MDAIEITNLSKSYGRRVGVEDVSFSVAPGSIFGFLGPNGAGKTTTIRVLMGLLRPGGGAASIGGLDCWKDTAAIKRQVGYLPGDLRLYGWMNAAMAVELFGNIRDCDIRSEAGRLLQTLDLDPKVRVKSMSRGMRQKLGLVLALAHRPKVAILDEPTASLDPLMQHRLYAELRSLAAAGSAILFSSHTLSEVEKLCEKVAIIREGRIVANEPIESLRRRARRMVTIRWNDTAPPVAGELGGLLEIAERGPSVWRGRLAGTAVELMRWCQGKSIADISIEEPDLSALFQDFYQ